MQRLDDPDRRAARTLSKPQRAIRQQLVAQDITDCPQLAGVAMAFPKRGAAMRVAPSIGELREIDTAISASRDTSASHCVHVVGRAPSSAPERPVDAQPVRCVRGLACKSASGQQGAVVAAQRDARRDRRFQIEAGPRASPGAVQCSRAA
jgi:hypothetical protein